MCFACLTKIFKYQDIYANIYLRVQPEFKLKNGDIFFMIQAKLTETGIKYFNEFLNNRKARQEKILNAKIDTISKSIDITQDIIEADILDFGDTHNYYKSWAVTDNPRYDMPLLLIKDKDYIIYETD